MFHKKIETKKEAIEYLQKGKVSEMLNRLDHLSLMVDTVDNQDNDSEDE